MPNDHTSSKESFLLRQLQLKECDLMAETKLVFFPPTCQNVAAFKREAFDELPDTLEASPGKTLNAPSITLW